MYLQTFDNIVSLLVCSLIVSTSNNVVQTNVLTSYKISGKAVRGGCNGPRQLTKNISIGYVLSRLVVNRVLVCT